MSFINISGKMIYYESYGENHTPVLVYLHGGPGASFLDFADTAKALKAELKVGGFSETVVHGVMGGAWLAHNIDELWKNEKSRNALMNTVRLLDTHEEIIGLSCHLLAVLKRI